MSSIDFDFGRYVAMRKGEVQQRARDGAAYSYSGERKVRRALASARPVLMAIEATSRMWKKRGRAELTGGAVLATDESYPEVFKACTDAARVLALEPPPVYVTASNFPTQARALGTDGEAYILIARDLALVLEGEELLAVLGHELGHIQNNHLVYTTALFYLRHSAGMFVRWIVQPAIMALNAWARRAELTCDRAALIVTRDLDVTLRALVKADLAGSGRLQDADVDALVAGEDGGGGRGIGRYAELFRSMPYLPKRLQAVRVFAESRFFKKFSGQDDSSGLTSEEVDDKVAELVSIF